ncbi:MAG: response regulator [Planctomycetes bacterium]|nr:response regulator [Planctomycetota bacterium]
MRTGTVLVVSEDPDVVREVSAPLERAGLKIAGRANGLEALDHLRSTPADLVVADVKSRVIDGTQLCRVLKSEEFRRHNGIPVLLLAAGYLNGMIEPLAREVGASGILRHPFKERDLLSAVETLLAAPHEPVRSPACAVKSSGRVLVVEDDPDIVASILAILKREYEVTVATDGDAAIGLLQEHQFHLLIADYRLPRRDGLAVVRWAKERYPFLGVILMTAYGSEDLVTELLRNGVDDYLRKPFDTRRLPELCGSVLRKVDLRRVNHQLQRRDLELIEAHTRIVKAERLAAIGELALAIRSELNSPMTVLQARAELLLEMKEGFSAEAREDVRVIRDVAAQLWGVIARLGSLKDDRSIPCVGSLRMTDLGPKHEPEPGPPSP